MNIPNNYGIKAFLEYFQDFQVMGNNIKVYPIKTEYNLTWFVKCLLKY